MIIQKGIVVKCCCAVSVDELFVEGPGSGITESDDDNNDNDRNC